jgi:heptosyltransferase-2
MKMLVIRSGAIGDVIMATPFLKNLRQNFKKAKISFLVGNWSKDVLKNNPNVDEIISFDDKIIIKKRLFKVLFLIKKIKKQKFDLCFILDKSWLWNLFAFLCKIKTRMGFSRNNEGFLNTKSVPYKGQKNEVDYNLDLLKLVNIKPKQYQPELFTTKKDQPKKFLKNAIGIAPGGASNPGQKAFLKRWPIENYIELVDMLKDNVIIFGNNEDKALAKLIIRNSENKNIQDATGNSLQQAKELMEKCKVIVTHDSGSLHIASTTKTKLIALFGPTPSKRLCPKRAVLIETKSPSCYTIKGKFVNCKSEQMKEITVEEVIKKI